MVVLLVILTIIAFVIADFAIRTAMRRREEARLRQERAEALDVALKLDFATEARSLKRVEVDDPRARILAVDDEPVILDSFRKILVLEGYSVDTVESAEEALGLVRHHDYDFVFTDLKMPGMDGLDLTKAVKHLRPDIDVVMITGYGTIASAVETMRFGAMDYVEKPFTADELADFTRKCLIRRQARIEQQTPPSVRVVTAPGTESESPHVINVPGGLFVSPQHVWVSVSVTGEGRVGLDDLALKTLGTIEEIEFPNKSSHVAKGAPLFVVRRGNRRLVFASPLTGTITKVNHELTQQLEVLARRPTATGWICAVEPENLTAELATLKIGSDSLQWYESQVSDFWERLMAAKTQDESEEELWETIWKTFDSLFLKSTREPVPA